MGNVNRKATKGELGHATRIIKAAFGLSLLSLSAAHAYVVAVAWLLVMPVHCLIVLNDWLYDSPRWAIGRLVGTEHPKVLASLSLLGELGLFGILIVGFWMAARRL